MLTKRSLIPRLLGGLLGSSLFVFTTALEAQVPGGTSNPPFPGVPGTPGGTPKPTPLAPIDRQQPPTSPTLPTDSAGSPSVPPTPTDSRSKKKSTREDKPRDEARDPGTYVPRQQ